MIAARRAGTGFPLVTQDADTGSVYVQLTADSVHHTTSLAFANLINLDWTESRTLCGVEIVIGNAEQPTRTAANATPRVWHKGDAEPADAPIVRDSRPGADFVWHTTSDRAGLWGNEYGQWVRWASLVEFYAPLTEVLAAAS